MSSLPRLSGALRAYTGLINDEDKPPHNELQRKRHLVTKNKTLVEGSGWQKLAKRIEKESDASPQDVKSVLKELLKCARQLVGDTAEQDVAESSAVFLFQTFKFVDKVGTKETNSLRGVFGPFPASVATKACTIVNRITSWLSDDVAESLTPNEREEADGAAAVQEFGKGIKFVQPSLDTVDDDLSSSESEDENKREVNLHYTASSKNMVTEHKNVAASSKGKFDADWLRQEIHKYFGHDGVTEFGLSIEDLTSTVFDVLTSPRPDSELQNELFELLGFDRFELIQSLLQNREKLLNALTKDETPASLMKRPKLEGASRPAYGAQVTVQSKQEKELLKQMRKEEKKLASKGVYIEDQEKGFNPAEMRAQREAALQAATSTPLFSGKTSYKPRERYPNVFDKMEEARLSSAFIGGVKMHLPSNLSRENNKVFEKVNLPPSDPAPTNIGAQRVKIAELDEIAQMAFKNTKALNRIQSVVFDTAYKTNENLLICAPTGAGKTNIAMLTILQAIKQHISQGVIKKDEFKIIYVAPMKALAAEMVRNFGSRLEPLGISVRELTGDMSLTKSEILKTQMMVTTPEKWDVVTRKSTGDVALAQLVKLLIIDEVHLLHDDRGAVIESLVARTLRQVETSQSMIRIVGLSATLPNYLDVARFLHVNPYLGLFFFDGRFRPVPLGMAFIGIKTTNRIQQIQDFNTVCYDEVMDQVRKGYQVMVFVHARNETVRTASLLRDAAKQHGDIKMFLPEQSPLYGDAEKNVMKSRNKQMKELFCDGFSIHHAGMLRQDRNLVERYFAAGHIKVLVCTATLAWGVNLPAHAVIIKGTQIYDAKKGAFVDLGILDVMQIFGRAGRPQFDTFGQGTIITTHDKLSHYLSLMTRQNPIESQFINSLTDNLNAEIALGTVTNVEEAVKWLSYTYLFVRLTCNPLVYGVPYKSVEMDPSLTEYRRELIFTAGRKLDKARMVRFDERTEYFASTDQGRIASHFYIKYDTVEVINEHLKPVMTEADVFALVSNAQEFDQIKVRDEESDELENILHEVCEMQVPGGTENNYGKVNILLQGFVSRHFPDSFSLVSDQSYVAQNAARILRSLFEICLKKGMPIMASRLLNLSKTVDKRIWGFETPLRQFSILTTEIINKIEARRFTVDKLREMDAKELGHMLHHVKMGSVVKRCVHQLPLLDLEATIQPITRTVLRVRLVITPMFKWDDKVHGNSAESFWIWVEDPVNNHIYHSEYYLLHKKQMYSKEPLVLVFTIPIFEPLPVQYYVKAISDRWLGSESMCAISFQHLILPERHPPHTELLNLHPLPVTALMDPMLETLYKFTHFNPIQTQLFHVLYHTDHNVLLGAPTGSGKTIAAELAIFRVFRESPTNKAVYIAPLKALVRERIEDWKVRIEEKLGKKVVELTGDVTPDMRAIAKADLIITTPEKWDGVSRSWQTRNYVKAVSLIVIDEIHLLGNDRGPVLEVIVSRTNFISSHVEKKVRVVGLSTALANARDLADWLGIGQVGLYNFRPSVRPVPLEVHIQGFPGQHYCPRMATMNKPVFQSIKSHSPAKPVLVFVSSRRQTRLTALDLIAFLAGEDDPKQWLHMPEMEVSYERSNEKCHLLTTMKTRITLKCYILILCSVYFSLLYVFYGRLQVEIGQSLKDSYSNNVFQIKEKSKHHVHPRWREQEIPDMKRRMLESKLDDNGSQRLLSLTKTNIQRPSLDITKTTEGPVVEDTCYLSAQYPNRTFQQLQQFSYIYSAYLDERLHTPFVRIMAVFGNYKKARLLPVYCYFNIEKPRSEWISVEGTLYELCENHGKKYGGFIVSCNVPENLAKVCSVGVYQQSTNVVKLPVTRLEPKRVVHWRILKHAYRLSNSSNMFDVNLAPVDLPKLAYNYSICVPPLFGNIRTIQFVEFVEIHRILGFQHFIFYVQEVSNPEILKVLKYYERLNVVTVIKWKLPIHGKNDIWYNGQLNAHNDCMYRAMSLSKFVAIIDIDEAIVPHDGHLRINESVEKLLKDESICGLSFYSAFYGLKFTPEGEGDSDLISMSNLGRSQFSTIRTKVMVSPLKVFEVGIHHISKPFREEYKVLKVNQSTAFLHHYRKCVQNYGMKCGSMIEDNSMLKYKKALVENISNVFIHALSQHMLLHKNETNL